MELFGGTVPPNNTLFGRTVPPNNTLFGGTVPPNSTLFGGTPDLEKLYLIQWKVLDFKSADMHASMYANMQVCKYTIMQVCKYVYKYTSIKLCKI